MKVSGGPPKIFDQSLKIEGSKGKKLGKEKNVGVTAMGERVVITAERTFN